MNTRKGLLISLVLTMIILLTACKPAAEPIAPTEAAPVEVQPTEESIPEPEVPDKFSFSTWGDPTFFEDGFESMKEDYPEYAGVEWEFLPGGEETEDLLAKLIVDMAAESWDTMPDAAEMSTSYVPQLAKAGVLVDLTELIEPYKDHISPAILNGVTWNGSVWAVPWMPNTGMIWYNKEVFDMAGVNAEDIETWDDFIEAGKIITEFEYPDGVKRYMSNADIGWGPGMQIQIMLQQQCSGFFDPLSGDLTIDTDPAFRKAFEFWVDVYNAGIFLPIEEWETSWFDALNEGVIATYISANWMDQVIQMDLENAEGKWRAMKLPAFEPGGCRAAFEAGSANVIILNKPDIDLDLTWAFLQHSFLNPDVTGDLAADHMLVPAYMPALSNPYYSEPNEFYGGQIVGALDLEIQEEAQCAFPYTENFAEAQDLILVEMQEVWAGNKTIDQAIADAAEAIRFAIE
jgi:ABC-type glycerol-3-phosphate transport system substrate-binding protein